MSQVGGSSHKDLHARDQASLETGHQLVHVALLESLAPLCCVASQ